MNVRSVLRYHVSPSAREVGRRGPPAPPLFDDHASS